MWIAALDKTYQPEAHYYALRDRWLPELVFGRMKRGDELHVLEIDSDPEDGVVVLPIQGTTLRFSQDMAQLYSTHIRSIEPAFRGTTNIAGALAYAARVAEVTRQVEGEKAQVVVLIFTDGKPTGPQPEIETWPQDVPVWFFGIENQLKVQFSKWVTDRLPSAQVELVPYVDCQTKMKLFAQRIGREFVDSRILKQIKALPAS